jgi:Fe2+ or Zn2+ uptake regulation protein
VTLDLDGLSEALRTRGLRVTAARVAVYRAAAELDGHPDAEAIAARARTLIGTLSTQATYDTLHTLTRAGLLRRIELPARAARFETRVGDNHHHAVCRSCGLASDVDCVRGSAPCLDAEDAAGFLVDEADATFWGLCADCQLAQA